MVIYKILLPSQWAEFESAGTFAGSPFDLGDGFIHCSSREQVAQTARRVFGGEPELVVVALDAEALGEKLRWEPAPNRGEDFPHIYGDLPMSVVRSVRRFAGAEAVETMD